MYDFGSIETCLIKHNLSNVIICEKLITDVLVRPDTDLSSRIFPGALAKAVFEVMTAQITVFMELLVNVSAWMMSTGRVFPGSEARGRGSFAHQISPLIIRLSAYHSSREIKS